MLDIIPANPPLVIKDFETWFTAEQFPVELKEPFRMGWEAALIACDQLIDPYDNRGRHIGSGMVNQLSTMVDAKAGA